MTIWQAGFYTAEVLVTIGTILFIGSYFFPDQMGGNGGVLPASVGILMASLGILIFLVTLILRLVFRE